MKEVRYYIGNADEGNEYYLEALEIGRREYFKTKEACELAIIHNLEDWGYAEGWTRADYDIAKVTITVERS